MFASVAISRLWPYHETFTIHGVSKTCHDIFVFNLNTKCLVIIILVHLVNNREIGLLEFVFV